MYGDYFAQIVSSRVPFYVSDFLANEDVNFCYFIANISLQYCCRFIIIITYTLDFQNISIERNL